MDFLLTALKHIEIKRPFLGPSHFKKNMFEYIEKSEGDVDKFRGEMKILYRGKVVFEASYNGSFITEYLGNGLLRLKHENKLI